MSDAERCPWCGTEVTPGQLIGNTLANGAAPKLAEVAIKSMRLHTDETDRLRKRVAELEAAVERLAPVVAAVERWYDKGADATGIAGALQRYREKLRAGNSAGNSIGGAGSEGPPG